jgi:hypothetical protein
MQANYRSHPRPLVPHLELSIGPIASGDRLTPTLGVYYPRHTMLGASKRVDFELTFAPSALEKLARVNAEVDLERAHVVLPDGKRYPFFPDWRDHTWEGYAWIWHPNDFGNRRGLGIRYAPLGRVTIEAASAAHAHKSFFEILNASDVDTDHPYLRRLRPHLETLDERSRTPLGPRPMVTREFLPGVTVTAPDSYSCKRALEKVDQVCGKALRAFHAERNRWAEWERQCAEANARLMPGSGGHLARGWQETGIEELRKLMDQRLQEPRRLLANPDVGCFDGMEYLAEEVLWTHSMLGGIEVHVSPMAVHHSALHQYLQRFPRAEKFYPETVRSAVAMVIPEWERLGLFVPQESIDHPRLRIVEHELVHLLFHLVTAEERTALRRYCRESVRERRPVPYVSSLQENGHWEHGTALEILPTCAEVYMGAEGPLGQEWHRRAHPFLEQFFDNYIVR